MPTPSPAPVRDKIRSQLLSDAVIGAIAWTVLFFVPFAPQSGHVSIERLLLLASLVIVPLGVRLAAWPDERGKHPLLFTAASYLHPLAAVLAVGSVLLPPGLPAGFAASAWCAYCVLLAAWGIARFVRDRARSLAELAIDAGLVYAAVGGAWFVCSRVGARPLGFDDETVALTAVHFHYAGFAAPLVAGLAGRALARSGGALVPWRIGARAVVAAPIVIAIGILVSPLVEVIASFALAIALTLLFAFVALRSTRAFGPIPALLAWTCAGSLVLTMLLSCAYALGRCLGADWIGVERMVELHGFANALGFALPGLLAFTIEEPRRAA